MFLTDDEKRMRDGAEGAAVAAAMDLLIRYGKALDAENLCDIRNVAGTMTQPTPVKARIVKEYGWDKAFAVINLDSDGDFEVPDMRVPTCQLQHGFGQDALGVVPYPKQNIELQASAESFYGRHGVNILATCTPYQVGNLPVRGEHCAWMESSAVVYCNSVLGARTNTEGRESTSAAMLTGKIPDWGFHCDEYRLGTHHIEVDVEVASLMDWGMLGYFVGEKVQERIPVLTGRLAGADLIHHKHFGAAAASSGGVEMYHMVGITPEAGTLEQAFGHRAPRHTLRYGKAERRWTYDVLNSRARDAEVDYVMLGCPHAALEQIKEACELLAGRRISANCNLWIFTSRAVRSVADSAGYTRLIREAGGHLLTDTCSAISQAVPPGTKVAALDSAKQVHYLPAMTGIQAWFGSTRDCIQAALTGRWSGEPPT